MITICCFCNDSSAIISYIGIIAGIVVAFFASINIWQLIKYRCLINRIKKAENEIRYLNVLNEMNGTIDNLNDDQKKYLNKLL